MFPNLKVTHKTFKVHCDTTNPFQNFKLFKLNFKHFEAKPLNQIFENFLNKVFENFLVIN